MYVAWEAKPRARNSVKSARCTTHSSSDENFPTPVPIFPKTKWASTVATAQNTSSLQNHPQYFARIETQQNKVCPAQCCCDWELRSAILMSHLPFMVLKRRIPSAGPQIWIRSSLLILSRSAPATTAQNLFCFLPAQKYSLNSSLFLNGNALWFSPLLPEKLEKSLENGENLWRCSHCWVSCSEVDGRRCYMSKTRIEYSSKASTVSK